MKNNLVLIEENENLVVECLNGEFEFVHNQVDGSNWFNQKTLAKMFGVTVQSISQSLKTISKHFPKESRNPLIIKLRVNSNNKNNTMFFYDFKVVTMLASRINTSEAFDMLEWIDSSLNTMFNVATGKTDMDTKLDKLKNMLEVEELKSDKYLQVYKELIKFDEELANETYHKYKVSKNNSFNCHELLMAKRDWDKRYNEVRDTIEPGKNDGSRQLLLF